MNKTGSRIAAIILSAVLIAVTAAGYSQSGGDFAITKSTIDGGGGESSGGDLSLTGTIGQHDASLQPSTGNDLAVAGGFWATAIFDLIFKDGFEDL